jgi:hypothetical protein
VTVPKSGSDVFLCAVGQDAVEALVGSGTLQWTEMTYKRPYLDVIEVSDVDSG